jgi:hypothetical protein
MSTYVKSNTSGRRQSSRDIIAEKIGLSSTQIQRILFIEDKDPEFINQIDSGDFSINQIYTQLQNGNRFGNHQPNREISDFYETPYTKTQHLLKIEKFDYDLSVCEPACGGQIKSELLQIIQEKGALYFTPMIWLDQCRRSNNISCAKSDWIRPHNPRTVTQVIIIVTVRLFLLLVYR